MSPAAAYEPKGKFPPLIIPRLLARSKDISGLTKLVYAALLSHRGSRGLSAPSAYTLAADTGITIRQIHKHLSVLEAEGFIIKVPQPPNVQGEVYAFLPHLSLRESAMQPAFPQAAMLRERLADLRLAAEHR